MRIPNKIDRSRAAVKGADRGEAVAEDDGYEWPDLDDILADEANGLIDKPGPAKRGGQPHEEQVSGCADLGCGAPVQLIEVILKYRGDVRDGLLSERIGGILKSAGVEVVRFSLAPAGDVLPWPVPSPGSGGAGEKVPRVHRVGAPRKWSEDVLVKASEALPSVLTQEQRRERRRAQIAAASRRLRERRRSGVSGTPD